MIDLILDYFKQEDS